MKCSIPVLGYACSANDSAALDNLNGKHVNTQSDRPRLVSICLQARWNLFVYTICWASPRLESNDNLWAVFSWNAIAIKTGHMIFKLWVDWLMVCFGRVIKFDNCAELYISSASKVILGKIYNTYESDHSDKVSYDKKVLRWTPGKEGSCCQESQWTGWDNGNFIENACVYCNAKAVIKYRAQNPDLRALNHENWAALFSGVYASL